MTPTLKSRRLHGRRGLKCDMTPDEVTAYQSPPSRAAWIEIIQGLLALIGVEVAAFTGGVD